MVITDYRVQSVLRTYARQLQRSKLGGKWGRDSEGEQGLEKVSISEEGKRRLMMDRLTSQVLKTVYPKQNEEAEAAEAGPGKKNGLATEGNQ